MRLPVNCIKKRMILIEGNLWKTVPLGRVFSKKPGENKMMKNCNEKTALFPEKPVDNGS